MNKTLIALLIVFIVIIGKAVPGTIDSISKISRLKNEIELIKEKIEIIDRNIKELDEIDVEYEEEKIVRDNIQMIKSGEHIYVPKELSVEE